MSRFEESEVMIGVGDRQAQYHRQSRETYILESPYGLVDIP